MVTIDPTNHRSKKCAELSGHFPATFPPIEVPALCPYCGVMASNSPLSDPVALIRALKAEEIRARLRAIEAERQALLVLLRAANASERRKAVERAR